MAFIINNNFCNCIQIREDTRWILILFLIYFLLPVAPSRADLHSQSPFCPETLHAPEWNSHGPGDSLAPGCTLGLAVLLENEEFIFLFPFAFSYLFIFYKEFPLPHPLSLY